MCCIETIRDDDDNEKSSLFDSLRGTVALFPCVHCPTPPLSLIVIAAPRAASTPVPQSTQVPQHSELTQRSIRPTVQSATGTLIG